VDEAFTLLIFSVETDKKKEKNPCPAIGRTGLHVKGRGAAKKAPASFDFRDSGRRAPSLKKRRVSVNKEDFSLF
jgi:hypothetical protein